MSGSKLATVCSALLELSSLFGPSDRACLVAFNHSAVQLTPLAPMGEAGHEARFRKGAMELTADGGTSIHAALALGGAILAARSAATLHRSSHGARG